MRNILALVAVAAAVTVTAPGCEQQHRVVTSGPAPTPSAVEKEISPGVFRVDDEERGVTCYMYSNPWSNKGGISCYKWPKE